jgi:hypothetical protein
MPSNITRSVLVRYLSQGSYLHTAGFRGNVRSVIEGRMPEAPVVAGQKM